MKMYISNYLFIQFVINDFLYGQITDTDDTIDQSRQGFKKLTLSMKYLEGARWTPESVDVTNVYFSMEIFDVSRINLDSMDFRVDLLMRQRWHEDDLIFPEGLFLDEEPGSTAVILDDNILKDVWTPDTFLPLSRDSSIGALTTSQATASKVIIYKNKTIVYSVSLSTIAGCQMNFRWFPLDVQECEMILESYTYSNQYVLYVWENNGATPIVISDNVKVNKYFLVIPIPFGNGSRSRLGLNEYYSYISLNFTFERQVSQHIITVFVPSFLIVALSWFNFWLALDAIPGRISLVVTCMLTLVTMYSGLKADVPQASYIKMIDIWMAGCLAFVFAAIFEFVVVKFIHYKNGKAAAKKTDGEKENMGFPPYYEYFGSPITRTTRRGKAWDVSTNFAPTTSQLDGIPPHMRGNVVFVKEIKKPRGPTDWERIDAISRIAFPTLFCIFMAVFWIILLYFPPDFNY